MPGPGMAVYYASKAYVLSFSEALYRELKPKGVRVTVLCPGPVPTEFQARAGLAADALPRILIRSAEQVARDGYRGLKAGRRVVVSGLCQQHGDDADPLCAARTVARSRRSPAARPPLSDASTHGGCARSGLKIRVERVLRVHAVLAMTAPCSLRF